MGNEAFSGCSSLTTINYTGTQEDWLNLVSPALEWDINSGEYTVYCTNGVITKPIPEEDEDLY
jgi:hypothetical protein